MVIILVAYPLMYRNIRMENGPNITLLVLLLMLLLIHEQRDLVNRGMLSLGLPSILYAFGQLSYNNYMVHTMSFACYVKTVTSGACLHSKQATGWLSAACYSAAYPTPCHKCLRGQRCQNLFTTSAKRFWQRLSCRKSSWT